MQDISKDLRKICLRLSSRCKDGNIQSAFSCMEIVWTLYDKVMKWSPETATADDRDIFIISKGQATFALYPVLIKKEYFTEEEFHDIGDFGSTFSNQSDVTKFRGGVENSAGSLGHGLPTAVGVALSSKIRGIDTRVFVLCGDGEFCEGTMWESLLMASSKKLDNLCVIIDDNNSVNALISMGSLRDKLVSFGFNVFECDGHDLINLEMTLKKQSFSGTPTAIIAKTNRGHGSKTISENPIWFHKWPNADEVVMLSQEIDKA